MKHPEERKQPVVESTPQHGDREQGEESEGEAPAGAATEEAGAQAL